MAKKKHLKLKGILSVLTVCLAIVCSAAAFEGYPELVSAGENSAELKAIDKQIDDIDVARNYRLDRELDVAYGKVYKLQQVYRGVDVYGAELSVSVDADGKVLSKNGVFETVQGVKKGVLDFDTVTDLLRARLGEVWISDAQQVVFRGDRGYEYGYELTTDYQGGTKLIVSQTDASILECISLGEGITATITQKDLFGNDVQIPVDAMTNGTYYLRDTDRNIYVYNGANETAYSNTTGQFDADAVTVYNNVITSYDYYKDANNIGVSRTGIDDKNVQIRVHVNDPTYNGNTASFIGYFANNYTEIRVDPANGSVQPAKALDIIAHEYQHGVTETTANLKYEGESGALDEAISDIFGALIEGNDPTNLNSDFWKMGEYATTSGCLRSMTGTGSGTNGYVYDVKNMKVCTKHSKGRHDGSCDYNYVHENLTIVTHMQYKVSQKMASYFTRERIGKLWYSTICMLNSNTNFAGFAAEFLQSAMNLGFSNEAVAAIAQTLQECGFFTAPDLTNGYHTVTVKDQNGDILATVGFVHGTVVTEAILKKYMPASVYTADEVYELVSWDRDIETIGAITADITLTATYAWRERGFLVIFWDAYDNEYYTDEVRYGEDATPPEIPPVREDTELYDYEFDHWEGDYTDVTEDRLVIPVYREYRCYFITLVSNGEVYEKLRYRNGSAVDLTSIVPEREPTAENTYKFIGWDKEVTRADADVTVNAKYEVSKRIYTVTYMARGEVYQTIQYYYNEEIRIPPLDYPGYVFDGWTLEEGSDVKFTGGLVDADGIVMYAMLHRNMTPIIIMVSVFGVILIGGGVAATLIILMKKKKSGGGSNRQRKY